jgi:BirA family transcriptional regulator, biotin operon repressor / biotin---[acetyl-CoA-carboxylase] ligase
MKYAVLAALKRHAGYVCGESLAHQMGISRVAVWKQVSELRAIGYRICSSRQGYRLEGSPDLLLPSEFPGWERRIHYVPLADSTMHVARKLARSGADEGTLVIAEQQSAGRGRLDRSWLSPPGGIYMTVITRPRVAPSQAPRINMLVAVAVSDVLERLYGVPARVKWPNDVLIEGKKVCGILAEMEAECDAVRFVNIGIGLNANSRIAPEQPTAVSLIELLGAPVDRVRLVIDIVDGILSRLPALTGDSILDEWRTRTVTIGRQVSILTAGAHVCGVAVDITSSGTLLVRDADGLTHEVVAGDCVQRSY